MKQNGSRTTNNIFSRRAWRKRYFVLQVRVHGRGVWVTKICAPSATYLFISSVIATNIAGNRPSLCAGLHASVLP
jgi:hypothetical protein